MTQFSIVDVLSGAIVQRVLFAVNRLPSVAAGHPATILQSPPVVDRVPSATAWPPSTVGWHPSTVEGTPSAVAWVHSTVAWPHATVAGRPSVIAWPQSIVKRRQSAFIHAIFAKNRRFRVGRVTPCAPTASRGLSRPTNCRKGTQRTQNHQFPLSAFLAFFRGNPFSTSTLN